MGPAPHKPGSAYRPWLVVSTGDHPVASAECIAVALTTTAHDAGLAVPEDAWVRGGSDVDSYASPWYVTTVKTRTLDRFQGRLGSSFVDRVASSLSGYVTDAG